MSKPNRYLPTANAMTENVAAAYWQGPLTRAEAQKVFDEYAATFRRQATALTQQDMCIAYLCEKFGVTPDDVMKWAEEKVKQAEATPEPSLIQADA